MLYKGVYIRVLYYKRPCYYKIILLQVVKCICSRKEQLRIVRACHIDATSGHLGIKKTHNRVAERFYWIEITKDVQKAVSSCSYLVHFLAHTSDLYNHIAISIKMFQCHFSLNVGIYL